MANNRIYLRCKQCGDVLYLGKTFSSCYYRNLGEKSLEEKLNEFYEKHEVCIDELKDNYYEPKLDEKKDRYSFDNQYDICYEIWNEESEK